jgi:uncharacterized protein (TIGR03086 family)
MDATEVFRQATAAWLERVRDVKPDQWDKPTPCEAWDVRTLVNHVVAEQLWIPPLMGGATIAEVGDKFDGDILGSDPRATAELAAAESLDAVPEPVAQGRIVHLSFGDPPASEYALGVAADFVVHGWDLAAATGGERRFPPELVTAVAQWFSAVEEGYRSAGQIAARPAVTPADPQDKLLVAFGRDPGWRPPGS